MKNADGLPPHYRGLLPQGDFCDTTGEYRHVEARVMCTAERTLNNSFTITEHDSCAYILTFLSTVPCTWQELRVAYKERFQVQFSGSPWNRG